MFLRCSEAMSVGPARQRTDLPLDSSSETSRSLSFADMERYRAVTDMRFDWRSERVSWEDMVFWRETG